MKRLNSEEIINKVDNHIYDCFVIGTGTSSEPVISHLSGTNFDTLIIDKSNIYKEYVDIDVSKKYLSRITPKQTFSNLKIHEKKRYIPLSDNVFLKCKNFSYIYSFVSGGLSNFWGGGLFVWPDSEIKKATSLSVKSIKKSYEKISERLKILSRNEFLDKSAFSNSFLKKQENNSHGIFRASKFFISEKGLADHDFTKEKYDQHLIWKSSHTIRKYINHSNNLSYFSQTTALSIKRNQNYYEIFCLVGTEYRSFKSRSIFLCAGVVNSTYLAFSLLNLNDEYFKLNHSLASITPIMHLGFLEKYTNNNIALPDLSWSLLPKGVNISGYLISSFFIHKKIHLIAKRLFFRKIYSFFENFLSSLAFLTIFTNSEQTNTNLRIKKISNKKNQIPQYFLEIKNTNNHTLIKKYIKNELKKLSSFIKGRFHVIKFLTQHSKIGGDIHYGSTMPETKFMKSPINTSILGEIRNAKNVYSCDASRLGYISSLPHTFTVMAVIDSSMPKIIKQLKKKEN